MNQSNIIINQNWKNFYKFAAFAALLIVLAGLIDIGTSMAAGEAQENSAISVTEWFALFQSNRFFALGSLGLINMITLSLGIPVYIALFIVHQRNHPAFAALASVIFFIGTAIYISSNTMLPILALSQQYASAPEAQKPLLEAAGRAALAQGADLTPGTFMGLLYTQLAGVIMSSVMLKGGVFSKFTGWLGLLGFGGMLIFFSLTAFTPALFNTALLISAVCGLALMAYYILFALKLFQLSR